MSQQAHAAKKESKASQGNAELGTALILVTHNERLAGRLGKKLFLVEGRLTS